MNQPRACWTVLLNKAQDLVDVIQRDVQIGRTRLQSLQASLDRLQKLYDDYQAAPAPGTASVGMLETMNQRQFAAQLLVLMRRVEDDMTQTERAVAHCRERLVQAERERLKMQSLVEQDLKAVKKHQREREQKQMDDMGVMQFNLSASH